MQNFLCAESLDTEHNTPATVAALNKALEKAKEVSDNLNATQKEVNDASDALYTAINNLLDIVDNSKLVKLLEAAQNLDTSKYTAETAEAFNAAVEAAVKVSENKDATLEEINKAYSDLAYAMMNLIAKVNTSELANTIAMAENILNNIDKYAPLSVKDLSSAVKAANAVLANTDATQEEINKAAKDLSSVLQLARIKADKTQLKKSVNKAASFDFTLYTTESVQAVKAALDTANLVMNNENADQILVDEARDQLNSAIGGMKLLSDDSDNSNDKDNDGKIDNSDEGTETAPKTGDSLPITLTLVLAAALMSVVMMFKKVKYLNY